MSLRNPQLNLARGGAGAPVIMRLMQHSPVRHCVLLRLTMVTLRRSTRSKRPFVEDETLPIDSMDHYDEEKDVVKR